MKKNNKRRMTVAITAVALVLLMMIGMTLAYLTDQRNVLNVLGIGTGGSSGGGGEDTPTIQISLTEPEFKKGAIETIMNEGEANEYTMYEMYNILPNVGVYKDPTVTNTGKEVAYVRVKMVKKTAVKDADGNITGYVTDPGGAALGVNDLYPFANVALATGWVAGDDGYFYRATPLAVGESVAFFATQGAGTTEDPTHTMKVPAEIDNEDLKEIQGILNLEIVAEAIQGRGFTQDLTQAAPWGDVPIIPAIRA